MQKSKIFIISLIAIMLFLSSCISNKESAKDKQMIDQTNKSIRVIADIKINTPDMKTKLSCEILIDNDSSETIQMTLKAMFGITAAKIWANQEKMLVFDMLNATAYTAKPSPENFNKILKMNFSLSEMRSSIKTSVYAVKPPNLDYEAVKDTSDSEKKSIRSYPAIRISLPGTEDDESYITIIPKKAFFEDFDIEFPEVPENMELINLD